MSIYTISGSRPLEGTLRVHGAKNSVLPILAAAVLCPGVSVIHNCPPLRDVTASLAILEHLGCAVTRKGDTVTVDAAGLTGWTVPEELAREMRSSVLFLGAILARQGQAELSYPGGCELGPRPIDLHLSALRTLGADLREEGGRLCGLAPALTGAEITLSTPSVGATENAMICAVAARGTTILRNAAREPEIEDLQAFLRTLGAQVSGAGTGTVVIQGGQPLHSGEFTVMGDRIVAATYLSAVAATGGSLELTGIDPVHLSTVTEVFREAGCQLQPSPGRLLLKREGPLRAARPIRTAPYPGFPTDAQPPVMAALCAARGTTLFVETLFSGRYRHVDELCRMGADIRVEGQIALVSGVRHLFGARVQAHDLRGGAALVVAALGAEGTSVVEGLEHIDRGYHGLDADLRSLGAQIQRKD